MLSHLFLPSKAGAVAIRVAHALQRDNPARSFELPPTLAVVQVWCESVGVRLCDVLSKLICLQKKKQMKMIR